jgi:hypothetical protein
MVLSLSPGETPLAAAEHVRRYANMWRISDDFWDNWPALHEQFARLRRWVPYAGPGHWPDADMLPFGVLDLGRRSTRFTPDEQRTVMTLWSIARSPLIMGGDLTRLDAFTLALLTNEEVIAVDQHSSGGHRLFNRDDLIGWAADAPGAAGMYLALFNARDGAASPDGPPGAPVAVQLAELGFTGPCRIRDLWQQKDLGRFSGEFAPEIPWHGAGLYRVAPIDR